MLCGPTKRLQPNRTIITLGDAGGHVSHVSVGNKPQVNGHHGQSKTDMKSPRLSAR